MYKAIKKFEVNGQTFQIGDDFPVELFEERLLRGKKIQVESKATLSSKGTSTVLTEDVKPKKEKAPKEESKEIIEDEILTDDTSNIEVKILEEDIENSEDK